LGIKFISAGRGVNCMENKGEQEMGNMAKGMDQKIEATAEMSGREEDMGANEMRGKKGG
jgi:hypothetical protein